jgi:hypothetical protein
VGLGDTGNIVCPVFPIIPLAALFKDFGVNGFLKFIEFQGGLYNDLTLFVAVVIVVVIIRTATATANVRPLFFGQLLFR